MATRRLLFLALAGGASSTHNLALIPASLDPSVFAPFLQTEWKFVPESASMSPSELEGVSVVVQGDIAVAANTTNAKLYQYLFTGYDYRDIPKIPAHMAVSNCHQVRVF